MGRTVAVIGGGYGGPAVAKALDSESDIVLIDPRDAFVNSAGSVVPAVTVSQYRGADLFTARFAEQFGTA